MRRGITRRLGLIAVVLLVLVAIGASSIMITVPSEEGTPPPAPASITYVSHQTIDIYGDLQFNNTLYPGNGVVSGNGTPANPYVISGWNITSSGDDGIFIRETTAHFVIRDCQIQCPNWRGIMLLSVENGRLESNNCSGNSNGMLLVDARNMTLVNNTCNSNGVGIVLSSESDNSTIIGNTCRNNTGQGLLLVQSNCSLIANNTLASNQIGMLLTTYSSHSIITGNYLRWNTQQAVLLDGTANCSVIDNDCSHSMFGVFLTRTSEILVDSNNCSEDGYMGIHVSSSSNVTVTNNTCSNATLFGIYFWTVSDSHGYGNNLSLNNVSGVYLYDSGDNNFTFNTCSENTRGFMVDGSSSGNTFHSNLIENHASWGFWIVSGSYNMIWNNTFIGNHPAGAQACDNGTYNGWNTSGSPHGFGNYWDDWSGPDADMDGIVDSPYVLDGTAGNMDYHPLATDPYVPIPEFGSVPVVLAVLLLVTFLMTRANRSGRR